MWRSWTISAPTLRRLQFERLAVAAHRDRKYSSHDWRLCCTRALPNGGGSKVPHTWVAIASLLERRSQVAIASLLERQSQVAIASLLERRALGCEVGAQCLEDVAP